MTLRTGIANTPYISTAYATNYVGIIDDNWYGYTVKTEAEKNN